MKTQTAKRNYILDILKVLCCFFVFRIHMGGVSTAESCVLLAVPIFIFITSYNYAQSSFNHDTLTLKSYYSFKNLLHKFTRLYIPYAVFAVCQLILIFALNANYSVGNVILSAFFGGYGPGNYYLLLMFQVILIFPLLLKCNLKRPNLTLVCCLAFYFAYHIIMHFFFGENAYDVTSVGGIISKWTIFRWVLLIDCGIYFYIKKDKIKWWQLAFLTLADIIPFILRLTTSLPTLYVRGIPYHFITVGIVGLLIKGVGNANFEKLNPVVAYCGNATWHIFLFQQLYFWLIDLLGWQFGFTYISFPICFFGGILFYTAQYLITKQIKHQKQKNNLKQT